MSGSELYETLVQGFHEVSLLLDERNSTLAADPVLAGLAARVELNPDSDDVKRALLSVLDSRELSGAAEVIQYFAHRFQWDWLRSEVEKRHLKYLTDVNHRMIRHHERMLEAFSFDWEDRDLFPSLDEARKS
jgi:hypothetical protein